MARRRALGALIWALRIRRGMVLENLRLAFPEKTEQSARHRAADLPELAQMSRTSSACRSPKDELERIFVLRSGALRGGDRARQGRHRLHRPLRNFEVLAAAHTLKGLPITMISRQMGKSG